MENVVSMANYTPHNANQVHTKDAALKRAVAEAVRKYVSPITGLTGQPTTADYRDPNAAATLTEVLRQLLGARNGKCRWH